MRFGSLFLSEDFSSPIVRLGGNFKKRVLNRKANHIGRPKSAVLR